MFTAVQRPFAATAPRLPAARAQRYPFPNTDTAASRPSRCPFGASDAGAGTRLSRVYCRSEASQADPELLAVDAELRSHVLEDNFPCVAARSAFNRGRYRFGLLAPLGSASATAELHQALTAFCAEFEGTGTELVTYLAVFEGDADCDEQAFEQKLWQQLQSLHELDARQHGWADKVDPDPTSRSFSFSVAGRAFFIVGMHPLASRLSRRAPRVTVVFNFHEQFEALRAKGKYEPMKTAIRKRDVALQGSINPVLARFGESSEARQYAGRAVAADWQCPFHPVAQKAS